MTPPAGDVRNSRRRDLWEIGTLLLIGAIAVVLMIAFDPKPSGATNFLGTAFGSGLAVISGYILAGQKVRSEKIADIAQSDADETAAKARAIEMLANIKSNIFSVELEFGRTIKYLDLTVRILNCRSLISEQKEMLAQIPEAILNNEIFALLDVKRAHNAFTRILSLTTFLLDHLERVKLDDFDLERFIPRNLNIAIEALDDAVARFRDFHRSPSSAITAELESLWFHRELCRVERLAVDDVDAAEAGFDTLMRTIQARWAGIVKEQRRVKAKTWTVKMINDY